MRSRYHVGDARRAHFVTSTIVQWLPVFTTSACCDILVDALAYCQANKDMQIYAWVILDNHFHAIVSAPELSRVMASLKRHTAQGLLLQAGTEGREWLVNQFEFHRAKNKIDSRHQVWQEGFHPQELSTDEVILQKNDYIHANPVLCGLVCLPEHWRYSSWHEWLAGGKPVLRCDRWR